MSAEHIGTAPEDGLKLLGHYGDAYSFTSRDRLFAVAFGQVMNVPLTSLSPIQFAMWRDRPDVMVPAEWDPDWLADRRPFHPASA